MRISDWSSDVCSSDLSDRLGELSWGVPLCVQIRPGALVVLEIGVSHTRCGGDEIWPLAELLCDLIIEHDECLIPGQSARASCRERVCQYVSISVVAIAVKKKTNNSKTSEKYIYESTTKYN